MRDLLYYTGASAGVVVIALILTIVGVILTYVLILPEKNENTTNSFVAFCRNIALFKKLYIESILRFFYIVSTVFAISVSALNALYGLITFRTMLFLSGLVSLVLLPIFVRIVYEGLMLFVLLVKNTIDINNKMNNGKVQGISFATKEDIKKTFSKKTDETVSQEEKNEDNAEKTE